jgi:hypothetical protein
MLKKTQDKRAFRPHNNAHANPAYLLERLLRLTNYVLNGQWHSFGKHYLGAGSIDFIDAVTAQFVREMSQL